MLNLHCIMSPHPPSFDSSVSSTCEFLTALAAGGTHNDIHALYLLSHWSIFKNIQSNLEIFL